jgi:hypothetical protein
MFTSARTYELSPATNAGANVHTKKGRKQTATVGKHQHDSTCGCTVHSSFRHPWISNTFPPCAMPLDMHSLASSGNHSIARQRQADEGFCLLGFQSTYVRTGSDTHHRACLAASTIHV